MAVEQIAPAAPDPAIPLDDRPGESVRDAFRAAFDEAKTALAVPAEDTPADDDEAEDPVVAGSEPDPAKPAKAAKVETPAKTDGLISEEEFSQLQTKHAGDPAALRRSLEGVFTKKTQALAAERTTYARLKDYQPFIDAYEANPTEALTRAAEQLGLVLTEKTETPAAPVAPAVPLTEAQIARFKASLGPELDYLADGLAPAINEHVQAEVDRLLAERLAPI